MTYAQRGAHAHRERDKTLRTCGCGAQFETIADDPPEACPACTQERNLRNMREWRMRRGEKIAEAAKEWTLVKDATVPPMYPGAKLSQMEVDYGVEFGSWAPGTRLTKCGVEHVVTQSGLEER